MGSQSSLARSERLQAKKIDVNLSKTISIGQKYQRSFLFETQSKVVFICAQESRVFVDKWLKYLCIHYLHPAIFIQQLLSQMKFLISMANKLQKLNISTENVHHSQSRFVIGSCHSMAYILSLPDMIQLTTEIANRLLNVWSDDAIQDVFDICCHVHIMLNNEQNEERKENNSYFISQVKEWMMNEYPVHVEFILYFMSNLRKFTQIYHQTQMFKLYNIIEKKLLYSCFTNYGKRRHRKIFHIFIQGLKLLNI